MAQNKEERKEFDGKVRVNDQVFELPVKFTYRQYHHITTLLKKATIPIDEAIDKKATIFNLGNDEKDASLKVGINIVNIIRNFMEQDILPDVMATVLVPEGKKWAVEMVEQNRDTLMDLDDMTIIEIVRDFLTGRGILINAIMGSLVNFRKENKEFQQKSKE